jgi:hypothetical protein
MSTSNEWVIAELLAYLRARAGANDTMAGIAEWWILHQRANHSRAEAMSLLDQLVRTGALETYVRSDGRTGYRAPTRTKAPHH